MHRLLRLLLVLPCLPIAAPVAVHAADLVLSRVMLSSGGVGYVEYAAEGHSLRHPAHQLDEYRRLGDFFARHLGGVAATDPVASRP